jgi:hypothetical protein
MRPGGRDGFEGLQVVPAEESLALRNLGYTLCDL